MSLHHAQLGVIQGMLAMRLTLVRRVWRPWIWICQIWLLLRIWIYQSLIWELEGEFVNSVMEILVQRDSHASHGHQAIFVPQPAGITLQLQECLQTLIAHLVMVWSVMFQGIVSQHHAQLGVIQDMLAMRLTPVLQFNRGFEAKWAKGNGVGA